MIRLLKNFLYLYRPQFLVVLVYMLQSVEYRTEPYLKWFWRTQNFSRVMQRRTLERTKPARLLLLFLRLGVAIEVLAGLLLLYLGIWHGLVWAPVFGLAAILAYPVVWAHLLVVPLELGRILISKPAEKRLIKNTESIFANHPGVKIAVAGSYGKTTMKELLATVLGEGLKVAATPANKNVSISHARFAAKLAGDEEVLIIEYGEGAPGDVARFARLTHPTHAVITGLAPAHLDRYKTIQAAGEDIFSVAEYLDGKNVYVNAESPELQPFIKEYYEPFGVDGCLGWKVSDIKIGLDGTDFSLKKDKQMLKLHSGLVGRHQVGFLAFVAALAMQLGLKAEHVVDGIAKTKPFEHRMQPYQLAGAWIVDDTYNGNLEGVRAGTQLLKQLPAKRKVYVTPGLVDQGEETERVHKAMGKLIAQAKPDVVVLMKNSVTDYIKHGLNDNNFRGELRIESNPLEFYTNLAHYVAVGDLIVMQNDWTDNYA